MFEIECMTVHVENGSVSGTESCERQENIIYILEKERQSVKMEKGSEIELR